MGRRLSVSGHIDRISRSGVSGWAYDRQAPSDRVFVSIFVNDVLRGICVADQTRPGFVPSAADVSATNYVFEFAFDPPLSPFIEHRVEVVANWSREPLTNGRRVLPRPVPDRGEGGPCPILLTSTGRSGTTMLMSELARHREIAVGDRYPYEIKQIAYHAAAFRTLVADADRSRSTDPNTMLARDMSQRIGGNPYNMTGLFDLGTSGEHLRDYYNRGLPSGYAMLFGSLIHEFYSTLASGQGKPAARYFCEKGDADDTILQAARLFFPTVKQIVIPRDPRDLLCSSIAFWKLSPTEAMTMLRTTWPRVVRAARDADTDTIVIRYEDLIRDPVFSRRAIADFLGLHSPLVSGPRDDAIVSGHRTAPSAAASIGRWRNELTPEQIAACETAFGRGMAEFDYPLSGTAATPEPAFAPRRLAAFNQIVAAEGIPAVSALLDDAAPENDLGCPSSVAMDLTFGIQGRGGPVLLDGWSAPEQDFVWSCAHESLLRLPTPGHAGDYQLRAVLTPFTSGQDFPSQRVIVLLDGRVVGTARVRDVCVLAIDVPAALAGSGPTVGLMFRFPDAVRPREIGVNADDRLLGCALSRLTLFHWDAEASSGGDRPARYIGAPDFVSPFSPPDLHRGAAE